MSTINRLSSVDALQPGDLIPVWDGSNGDTRKASLTTLLAFIESNFADPDYSTRIVAPNVDGFNVDIGNTGDSSWLIVNPTLNYTTGSITLPSTAYAVNDQEITVVFTAQVASFSITGAGATVLGAPTQIGTYDSFRVRYNAAQLTWYTLDTTGDGSGAGTSSIVRQDFTGDGVVTTFALANAPAALGNELQVFIDGVYQERAGYSVSGNDLVFSEAPPVLSTIEVLAWGVNDIGATTANLVTYTPAGTGAVATTVQDKLRESVSVLDFGAVGDGVTDDSIAFKNAINEINIKGCGTLLIPKGTYIVQWDYGVSGPANAFTNVNGLVIYGQDATVKIKPGSHNGNLWSDINAQGFSFVNCSNVKIYNLTLDGNGANIVYDGTYEGGAAGLLFFASSRVLVENCYIHNFGLDNIYVGANDLVSSSYDVTITSCRLDKARRHNLTLAAIQGCTVIDCSLTNAGNNTGVPAPNVLTFSGGVDVEPNPSGFGAGDIAFIGCRFIDNLAAGVFQIGAQDDVYNVTYQSCTMASTVGPTIKVTNPRTTFDSCYIYGQVRNFCGTMRNSTIVTYGYYVDPLAKYALFVDSDNFALLEHVNVFTDDSNYVLYVSGSISESTRKIIRNCRFNYNGNQLTDSSRVGLVTDYTTIHNCQFTLSGTAPATGYYVGVQYPFGSISYNISCAANIFWYSMLDGNGSPNNLFESEGVSNFQQINVVNGFNPASPKAKILAGTNSPEGVVTAGVGSLFLRTSGGTGTSLYVKESGSGNTGWIAK